MTSRRAPALRAVLAGLAGREVAARCRWAPARGSVASISSRSVPRAKSARSSVGEQSAPKVKRRRRRGRGDLDRVGRHEVRHGMEAQRAAGRACSTSPGRTRAASNAASIRSSSPGADDPAERLARARRRVQPRPAGVGARPAARDRLLAGRVGQRVGERDEIEEVVGVQVRDHDGVDVDVVDEAAQLGEHAVAAVEQQAEPPSSTR